MNINLSDFRRSTLFVLYIIGFIFAFTSSIPAYVNSSFIKSLTNEQVVGFFYTASSILGLTFLLLIPKVLKKYGNYKVTLFLTTLYFLNFLGLAFFQNIFLVLACFLLSGSIATIIYFNLDVFIEHNSLNIKTGGIRSIYLTCINLAWLFSPWLAGTIISGSSYRGIYFVTALIMVPVILVIHSNLKGFKDPEYKIFNLFETIRSISDNKNIKNIIFSAFLLQLFYSWMVVYTPIYLNQYIGFNWAEIGIIFSIMLLPFIIIQIPLGYLADKTLGEKEILALGFVIIAISTSIIPLINNKSIFVWSIVLFITRVGAAMVEVMNDTYFFKKVSDKNLNLINLYRTVTPMAYIITPTVAATFMMFVPMNNIFYILGLVMILGLGNGLAIKDTK